MRRTWRRRCRGSQSSARRLVGCWRCSIGRSTPIFSVAVRSVVVLVVSALLTGMLHLDGFVDCCDALLGTRGVERRLEILRDSRVGAYGAIGAALLCLGRFAAIESLPVGIRAFALVAAPLLGRWAIVYAVVRYPLSAANGRRHAVSDGRWRARADLGCRARAVAGLLAARLAIRTSKVCYSRGCSL